MEEVLSFLADNYKWFMIGAAVLLFALIGFIVDGRKKKKNEEIVPAGPATPAATTEMPVQPVAPVMPEEQSLIIEEPTLNPKTEEVEEVSSEPSLELNAVEAQSQPQPESIFSIPEVNNVENTSMAPAVGETPMMQSPNVVPTPVVESAPVMPEPAVVQPEPVSVQPEVAVPLQNMEPAMPEAPVSPLVEAPTAPLDTTNTNVQ